LPNGIEDESLFVVEVLHFYKFLCGRRRLL